MTIGNLCYDEQNDRILFFTELDSVSHLLAYSKANGVEWVVPANGDMPRQARFRNGRIYILRGSTIDVRSAEDGSLISSQGGFTGTSGIVRFDARTGALYTPTSGSGIEQWLPGRSSDDSAVLGDVVTGLCERVGLTAADLDVTEITDEVHGFGIARQISVRGALEMLAAAYSFDAVESDHQLKFKKRGRSPSLVIPERDLVPINAEREAFIETRAQEIDLPLRFTVVYQDRRFARTAHGNGLTGADHGAASVEGRTMRRRSGRARRKPVGRPVARSRIAHADRGPAFGGSSVDAQPFEEHRRTRDRRLSGRCRISNLHRDDVPGRGRSDGGQQKRSECDDGR